MQGGNPLANILVVIVGAIVIGVSIVLGFFAFLALSVVILLAATVIGVRAWWAGRKAPQNVETGTVTDGEYIEGEFHVVNKDKNS
jgi:membrane protein implicated in regulation of membrane protease activity